MVWGTRHARKLAPVTRLDFFLREPLAQPAPSPAVLATALSSSALYAITADSPGLDRRRQMLPDHRMGGGDLLDGPFEGFAYCGAGPFRHIGECPAAPPEAARQGKFTRQRFQFLLLVC